MDDVISRQQAIDALANYIHNVDKVYSTGKLSADDCRDAAQSVLDDLPSAGPKSGRWIHVSEEMWKCDQCGEISCCSPNFCPDCGSRNEVTE